ncbi:MAG: bifunctional precorrin-2 dehydrogenase/sirohydrochlorin ferrochelatase [Dehalococcoidia bacterium]|nr:MAG: bifunctional precorrin-2 dehydrogenase/sirohydrochlorin ferrochelatase [Dehalococcoidia bacterium]
MSTYYPIFLNIHGRKCVVVGGGEVAERKARALAGQGASVTVISARVCHGLAQLAQQGTIQISARDYQSGDLKDALIAIAATDDPTVNVEVAREGRERGVLTNVVDDPEHSDFIVPSLLRRGDISIAVSTGGKSPALARRIRTELEQSFASEYASLALLISEVRQELKRDSIHVDGNAWQKSLDLEPLLDMLKKGEFEQAKEKLLSNLLRK